MAPDLPPDAPPLIAPSSPFPIAYATPPKPPPGDGVGAFLLKLLRRGLLSFFLIGLWNVGVLLIINGLPRTGRGQPVRAPYWLVVTIYLSTPILIALFFSRRRTVLWRILFPAIILGWTWVYASEFDFLHVLRKAFRRGV